MHWILQTNLFQEAEWSRLVATLEQFGVPYSVHRVVPFVGELEPLPVLQAAKAVCFGSYSMRHSARKYGWDPGVYDLFDQDFLAQKAAWGDRMLNADSRILAFQEVRLEHPTFLRPIDDSKYFAGRVFDPDEFESWRQRVCDLDEDDGTSLSPTTRVQVCTPKTIHAEYRYWIVGGKIATKSLYKLGRRVVYAADVDERMDHSSSRPWLTGNRTARSSSTCATPRKARVSWKSTPSTRQDSMRETSSGWWRRWRSWRFERRW